MNNDKQKPKYKIKYKLDWNDDSILKVRWKSPNDKKSNLFNLIVNMNDDDFLKIKDNH